MKQLLFTSAIAMLLFSCQKKDDPIPVAPTPQPNVTNNVSDYTKPTVGNYWIYEVVSIDSLGNTIPGGTDSCYIKRDSVINGNTYAVFTSLPPQQPGGISLLRDSASFLVDQSGIIHFTNSDFNTVLYSYKNTFQYPYTLQCSVSSNQSTVIVPMGTYTCYDYMGTVTFSSFDAVRYTNTYYALNTGMVELTSFFLSSSGTFQYRLIRAHVM